MGFFGDLFAKKAAFTPDESAYINSSVERIVSDVQYQKLLSGDNIISTNVFQSYVFGMGVAVIQAVPSIEEDSKKRNAAIHKILRNALEEHYINASRSLIDNKDIDEKSFQDGFNYMNSALGLA